MINAIISVKNKNFFFFFGLLLSGVMEKTNSKSQQKFSYRLNVGLKQKCYPLDPVSKWVRVMWCGGYEHHFCFGVTCRFCVPVACCSRRNKCQEWQPCVLLARKVNHLLCVCYRCSTRLASPEKWGRESRYLSPHSSFPSVRGTKSTDRTSFPVLILPFIPFFLLRQPAIWTRSEDCTCLCLCEA